MRELSTNAQKLFVKHAATGHAPDHCTRLGHDPMPEAVAIFKLAFAILEQVGHCGEAGVGMGRERWCTHVEVIDADHGIDVPAHRRRGDIGGAEIARARAPRGTAGGGDGSVSHRVTWTFVHRPRRQSPSFAAYSRTVVGRIDGYRSFIKASSFPSPVSMERRYMSGR